MGERAEPDIFVRILNKVEQIDVIGADVREIKSVVREHSVKLAEHDLRFDRIGQILAEHDGRFDRIDQTLAYHTLRLDQLDAAVIDLHNDVKQHSHDISELKGRLAY